jgi:hypothetical protein
MTRRMNGTFTLRKKVADKLKTSPKCHQNYHTSNPDNCRSQWPRGLRPLACGRSPARIQPGVCVCVFCECCVLSGRGLCDELISPSEESYRLCSRNFMNEEVLAHWGLLRQKQTNLTTKQVSDLWSAWLSISLWRHIAWSILNHRSTRWKYTYSERGRITPRRSPHISHNPLGKRQKFAPAGGRILIPLTSSLYPDTYTSWAIWMCHFITAVSWQERMVVLREVHIICFVFL